jgi:hypothetical protein
LTLNRYYTQNARKGEEKAQSCEIGKYGSGKLTKCSMSDNA